MLAGASIGCTLCSELSCCGALLDITADVESPGCVSERTHMWLTHMACVCEAGLPQPSFLYSGTVK